MGILDRHRRRRWRAGARTRRPTRSSRSARSSGSCASSCSRRSPCSRCSSRRLQLIDGDHYQQRAALNQLRIEPVIPSRGLIYDRNGVPVVENVPELLRRRRRGRCSRRTRTGDRRRHWSGSSAFRRSRRSLRIEAARKSNDPVHAGHRPGGLDQEMAFTCASSCRRCRACRCRRARAPVHRRPRCSRHPRLHGPHRRGRVRRRSKDRGYLASDRLGKAGVEAAYEKYPARHDRHARRSRRMPSGRELRTLGETPATPGNDLVLSIDLDLQKKATELTQAAANGGQAAAVVMDVNTGEVLALVSLPMYDNNIFSGKVDEARLAAVPRRSEEAARQSRARRAVRARLDLQADHRRGRAAGGRRRPVARRSPATATSTSRTSTTRRSSTRSRTGVRSARSTSTAASRCRPTSTSTTSPAATTRTARTSMASASSGSRAYARQFGLGRKTGIDIAGEARRQRP